MAFLKVNALTNALDSLETAAQLSQRPDDFKWKWVAFAIHHALYSFAISALVGGNFERVLTRDTGHGHDDENDFWRGGQGTKYWRSRRQKFPGIRGAYRIVWEETDEMPPAASPSQDSLTLLKNGRLIGFWTAFARIQDERRMGVFYHSRAVSISDDEFRAVAWLVTNVRNDLQHFIPKHWQIDIAGIVAGTSASVRIIEDLVFGTNTLSFDENELNERVKQAIGELRVELDRHAVASQRVSL